MGVWFHFVDLYFIKSGVTEKTTQDVKFDTKSNNDVENSMNKKSNDSDDEDDDDSDDDDELNGSGDQPLEF